MSDMMVKSKIEGEESISISEVESALECDVCLGIPQVNNKKATSFFMSGKILTALGNIITYQFNHHLIKLRYKSRNFGQFFLINSSYTRVNF